MTGSIRKVKAIITTPGVNEYDDILGQLDEQRGARTSRSIYSAADANPDQESALVKISRRSGVPVEALRLDNGAEARRRVAVKEAENLATVAPTTANWLTNPENARVAHDDLDKLAELERVARTGFGMKAAGGSTMGIASPSDQATAERAKTIGGAFVRGLAASPSTFSAGLAGTGEMIADFVDWSLQAFPDETGMRKRVADVARESRQYWENATKATMGGEQKPGSAESYFQQAGNSIGTSLLAAPFGIAGEGPALGMFGLSADGSYGEMREKGISVPMAAAIATSNKAMEGLTEKIGLDQLYKGSGPVVKKALGFLLGDLAGEEINTLYSAVADKVTIKPDMTMADVVQQVIDTAIVTSIAGGAQGVSMHGTAKASETLFNQYQARQEARRQSDFLLALGDSVKATKTFNRLPSAVQDLVKEIKQGGPVQDVFVPVERFTELFQSEGMDPGKAAEQILSDPSRYFEAVATGGDVAIPLEEFARLADAPFYKELVKDARTSLAGMTAREAETFGKDGEDHINALLAQAAEEKPAEEGTVYTDAYQKIYDDTFGQLVGVNVSPGEAEANATLRAKGLATLAQRYGYSPESLLEQFPLKVTRGDLPASLQRQPGFGEQQQAAQLATMLDAIRSGKGASQAEMFGPSLADFLREKGVKDDRGDLAAMDVDKGIKFKKKMLRENGLSLDKAREAAAEAGYLPADSTAADLLDLVDQELRGRPVYSPGNLNEALADQQRAHEELSQWLDMMGVDLDQAANDDVIKMMQEAVAGDGIELYQGAPLPDTIEIDGVKRPTANSKGEPITKTKEGVRKFWKWFGESKVVDAQGRPLVVYHGSPDVRGILGEGFVFQPGRKDSFFASDTYAMADSYADDRRAWDYQNAEPYTISIYLKLENPMIVDAAGAHWKETEKHLAEARNLGHDGIIIKNSVDYYQNDRGSKKGTVYAFFKSGAAKSAMTGKVLSRVDRLLLREDASNSGEFDPESASIFHQAKRGYIKILDSMPGFEIALLKGADASTFIHELGHYYEEILGRLAAQPDAPDQLKADHAAILRWLGAESKEKLTVEQREKFARGFEAYLYEGNAPSQDLRGVFQRFKTWLKAVYSSLKSLNVELTDEVRGVFDRLLATDQEIEAAEREQNVKPLFATAKDAGMSAAVFEAYRELGERAHQEAKDKLERAKLREAKRAHESWWKEARAKMATEVEAEAKADPVFEALHFLKTGRLFDGSPFQGDTFKLSGAELARAYDAPTVKAIRKKLGNVSTKEGGLSLAMVAEMFGFSSGDEMVKRMMEAPKLRDFIKAETDRRMMEVHGTMTGAEIAEEAISAVFNDDQAKLLREELRAIRRKAREVKPFVDAAKGEARAELRREKAERAYERRWMEAEKDLAVKIAAGAKQAEIDDLKAKIKADKERQKAAREFANNEIPPIKFFKEAARQHIAGLKVSEILPGKFSQAEAKASRQAFELNGKGRYDEAAAAKVRQLLNFYLYQEATAARKEADKIASTMRRLQTSKAQAQIGKAGADYLDQVNALLERYEFKKKTGKVLAERERLLEWVERMEERNGFPPAIPASVLEDALEVNYRTLKMSELRDVSDAVKAITFLARMDGKIQRAQELKDIHALAVEAKESIEAHSRGARPRLPEKSLPQDIPGKLVENYFASHRKMSSLARQMDGGEDGGVIWNLIIRPMNEAGDREAAMRAEAAGALAKIFGVYSSIERTKMHLREFIPEIGTSLSKWGRIVVALNMGNEGNLQRLGSMFSTRDQLDAVVGALDERDWQFVQNVWDYLDSFWPEIEAKEKRVTGVAPLRVEHTPVQTKYGPLQGGYWPIKYDREETAKAGAQQEQELLKQMMGGAFSRATTQRGHTEARLEAVNRPLTLSIDILFQHLNQVIHDLTHHEMLSNVGKLLGTTEISEAIRDHYGMETYRVFTDGLRDVAIGDIPAQDAFEKFMNYTRVGISTAGLGWNLVTSLMQPLGFTQSIVRVGPKWIGKGVGRWISSPKRMIETADWIYSKSSFMQTRALTQNREIAEIRNQMTVGVIPHAVRDSFFYFIQQMQKVVDIPTWLGQYEKSMAQHGNEADAIAEADQAVIDAQASGQAKDLARIQRGGPLKKMFTTFYSYFSTTYNLAAESKARTHFSNPSEVGRFLVDMLMLYTVPVVITTLLKEGIQRAIGGGDNDDELLKSLLGEQLGYITGGFIGLRELGSIFSGWQGYEGPAGSRFYSETSKLAKEIGQGEWDEGLFKRLNSVGGILLHYPATQVQRTVQGMRELADGRGNLLSLLFGKPKK